MSHSNDQTEAFLDKHGDAIDMTFESISLRKAMDQYPEGEFPIDSDRADQIEYALVTIKTDQGEETFPFFHGPGSEVTLYQVLDGLAQEANWFDNDASFSEVVDECNGLYDDPRAQAKTRLEFRQEIRDRLEGVLGEALYEELLYGPEAPESAPGVSM